MSGNKEFISTLRRDYKMETLSREQLESDPIRQFDKWFTQAVDAEVMDVNAMTIATVSSDGWPSARIVLLRSFDAAGFVFYTNYTSHKGTDLEHNPKIGINFFWPELERQVRIRGAVEKQTAAESDAYFALRPRGSKLGAWASPQSKALESRDQLEALLKEVEQRFEGQEVPRPEHWGGYRVVPEAIEFWQGRPSRLHDRFRYTRSSSDWQLARIAP